MDAERVSHFRKQLSTRLVEIQQILALESVQRGETQSTEADVIDRASRSSEREISFLKTSQYQRDLVRAQQALRRIATGKYGECMHCGGEIESKRLQAVPWAEYCKVCQELRENR